MAGEHASHSCFHCGIPADPAAPACPDCATSFVKLCGCDREVSAFAEHCPHCGLYLQPTAYVAPVPVRRLVFLGVLAALAVAAGLAYLLRPEDDRVALEPWRLKARVLDLMDKGEYAAARLDAAAVVERSPRDAEGWYLLAVLDKQLGLDPADYRRSAQRALENAPDMPEPLTFLAVEYREDGDTETARGLVLRAAADPDAPAWTWRLLAELELERASPDLGMALDALEHAYALHDRDARLLSQRAVVRLRMLGNAPRALLPDDAVAALDEAEQAISRLDPAERGAPELAPLRAEIAIGLGRPGLGIERVTEALGRLDGTAAPGLRERLLVVRARAELAGGQADAAVATLAEALHGGGSAAVAGQVVDLLTSAGLRTRSQVLLEQHAEDDKTGGVASALALRALAARDAVAARRWCDRALAAAPDSVEMLLLDAEVLRLEGRLDEARTALDELSRRPGAGEEPELRRALLALDATGSLEERESGILAAREHLAVGAGGAPSPRRLATLGALDLAAGRFDEAAQSFRSAVDAEPWTPAYWVGLGRATSRIDRPDASARAAAAFARAASLRPHDADLVLLVARAEIENDDPARAVGTCTVYLDAHPDDRAVRRARAEAARLLGHWRGAGEDLRVLFDAGAANADDVALLVAAYARTERAELVPELVRRERMLGRPQRADALERAYRRESGAPEPVASQPETDSAQQAGALVSDGHIAEGLAMAERVLGRRPGDVDAARVLVTALFLGDATDASGPEGTAERQRRVAAARRAVEGLRGSDADGQRELLAGCLELATGDAEVAEQRLRRVAAYRPDDAFAAFFHGQALFATGRIASALPALRRAVLLDRRPRSVFAAPVSVSLTLAAQMEDDATRRERLLAEAVALDPRNVAATVQLADMMARRGGFGEAAAVLERRLSLGGLPDVDALALRRRAVGTHLAAQNLNAALRHLEALEAAGSDVSTVAALRGWVLIRSGKIAEARELFRDVLARDPTSRAAVFGMLRALLQLDDLGTARQVAEAWRRAVPADRELSHVFVRMLVEHGKLQDAVDEARAAFAHDRSDLDALVLLVWANQVSGSDDAALGVLRGALRDATAEARTGVELLLGETCLRTPECAAEAREIAERLARDETIHSDLRRSAELLLVECDLHDGATDAARLGIARFVAGWPEGRPESGGDVRLEHRVRFVQGVLAAASGDNESARIALERTLALDASNVSAANNLAYVLALSPPTAERGRDIARRVTTLRPDRADYWDTRGFCEQKSGDERDAIESYRRAVALFARATPPRTPARAGSALALARLLRRTGRDDEARATAKSVLEFAAGSPAADEARDFLDKR